MARFVWHSLSLDPLDINMARGAIEAFSTMLKFWGSYKIKDESIVDEGTDLCERAINLLRDKG